MIEDLARKYEMSVTEFKKSQSVERMKIISVVRKQKQ